MTLAAGARTLLVSNRAAFESRYGTGLPIAGVYTGALDNNGERLTVRSRAGTFLDFSYNDWYPVTDGGGYSLVVVNPTAPPATYGSKANWRPSNVPNGGPGVADPGVNAEAVVINEVLANSGTAQGDWIELYNSSDAPIDIGGWYLSNDPLVLNKYQLPANTIVPANGYLVLSQEQYFGSAFDLSQLGADVLLTSNAGGTTLGGYREGVDFGASNPGITFGRFGKSTGGTDFVPMSAPTEGAANAQPLVGPLVMTEIMYHPAAGGAEFIELQNLSGTDLNVGGWKFIEGIGFTFPTGSSIPAFGYALVVGIDPVTFRSTYGVPAEVPIFGPFTTGTLDNNGGNLRLAQPGTPVGDVTPYVQVDQVKYDNSSPWPESAGGSGPSITRVVASGYGNDSGNWIAGPIGGTPGRPFVTPARPSGLTATPTTSSKIRLDWTDGSTGEDGFRIERSTDNVSFTLVSTVGANVTTFEDSNLSPDTFYYYRIRSFNNAGESGNSGRASARTFQSQTLDLIGFTDTWRYHQTADLGTAWYGTNYNDAGGGWNSGPGLLYVENSALPAPKSTPLTLGRRTYYFRIHFNLDVEPSQLSALKLRTIVDDGAVFYLNGNATPFFTVGMTDGQSGYAAFANRTVGEATIEEFTLPTTGLVRGDNVLAVEVHQVNDGSSDIVFGAELKGERSVVQPGIVADIVDVSPDPTSGPVNSITITFPEPVTGFGLSDLSLSRDGGPNLLTGAQTLTSSDGGRTWVLGNLGSLTFLASDYTLHLLAGGSGIVGSSGKALSADAGESFRVGSTAIEGTAGNDTYYIRVNGSNLEVFTSATPTGTPIFSAPLIDVPGLTINGAAGNDTVEVAGALPFKVAFNGGTGTDRLILSAGSHKFTSDSAAADSVEEIVAAGSGRVEIAAAQNLTSLTVRDSGKVDVTAPGVSTDALAIAGQGVLDLHEQDLVVHATAATRDAVLAAVSGFVRSARNGTNGRWTGPGLTSTTAIANPMTGLAPGTVGDDVVVKYTYNGDANLDGRINSDDYFRIDSGFLAQPASPGYRDGDFNYDGRINSDDYFLIDSAFLGQGAPLNASPLNVAAVPEPGTFSLLAIGAGVIATLRRRSDRSA